MTIDGTKDATDSYGDRVIRLRKWASDCAYNLRRTNIVIGSDKTCDIQLVDGGCHSMHAELSYDGQWWIEALGTSELRMDGISQRAFVVTPGMEIGIGTTTLIAEGARSISLGRFCQRLLGWGPDRMRAVDQALRALRLARMRKAALILHGDGDLVPIARGLHRRVLGRDAPFMLCDPRRVMTAESVRAPANMPDMSAALAAAAGGSLCVRDRRRPQGFRAALERLQEPACGVQFYVCMERKRYDVAVTGITPIELPPLQLRESELVRIIDEYAADAIAELDAPPNSFTSRDRQWVQQYAHSLHDIEKATLRSVAIRRTKNINAAATLLGMAHVSLSRWVGRRSSYTPGRGEEGLLSGARS